MDKVIFVVPGQAPPDAQRCSPAMAHEARMAYLDLAAWVKIEDDERFALTANCALEDAARLRTLYAADVETFGFTAERTEAVVLEISEAGELPALIPYRWAPLQWFVDPAASGDRLRAFVRDPKGAGNWDARVYPDNQWDIYDPRVYTPAYAAGQEPTQAAAQAAAEVALRKALGAAEDALEVVAEAEPVAPTEPEVDAAAGFIDAAPTNPEADLVDVAEPTEVDDEGKE